MMQQQWLGVAAAWWEMRGIGAQVFLLVVLVVAMAAVCWALESWTDQGSARMP